MLEVTVNQADACDGQFKQQMQLSRAREVWRSAQVMALMRNNRVLHQSDERITLSGSFTADQLEAMAVLMRAGAI